MTVRTFQALGTAALISAAIAAYGCGDHDNYHRHDLPIGSGVVVNLGSQALTKGQVQAITGSYGSGCGQPVGTTEWSIPVTGAQSGLPPALQVNEGSTECQLILTRVVALVDGMMVMFTASPGLALGAGFQGSAARFTGENGVSFYSNARLVWSGEPWRSSLSIEFLLSDDPNFDPNAREVTPSYVLIATPSVGGVPSPRYTFSTGSLSVLPPARILGDSALTAGSQAGTEYKIVPRPQGTTGTPTFAVLDAAYGSTAGLALPQGLTFAGSLFETAATGLGSTGQAVVWLIIANVQQGVRAFQAFEITFRGAGAGTSLDAGALIDAATTTTSDAAGLP